MIVFGRKIKTAEKHSIISGRNRNEKGYFVRPKTKNKTKMVAEQ